MYVKVKCTYSEQGVPNPQNHLFSSTFQRCPKLWIPLPYDCISLTLSSILIVRVHPLALPAWSFPLDLMIASFADRSVVHDDESS